MGGLRLLILQRDMRRFGLGLLVAQLLAIVDQLGERLLRRQQRGLGGGDVECGVVGDCRVLARAAQRAGLARLQLAAVVGEAADQAFLFEQLLLVGDLGAQHLVLLAQRDQPAFPGGDLRFALLQLLRLRALLGGEFAALAGEGVELLPAVAGGLLALPMGAQLGQCLAAVVRPFQALVLFGAAGLKRGVGSGFCLLRGVDRQLLGGTLPFVGGLLGGEFLLRLLLGGEFAGQSGALLELLAPGAEAFAKLGALRVGGAEVVDLLRFAPAVLQGLLRLGGDGGGVRGSGVVTGQSFGLQAVAFAVQRLPFGGGLAGGGVGLLPLLVQRAQRFRRFAVGQPLEFRRGGGQRGVGGLLAGERGGDFLFGLGEIKAPLALRLRLCVLALDVGELCFKHGAFLQHRGALLVAHQCHAVGAGLELGQFVPGFARLLEDLARDFTVDFAAGQFFEQFGALVGAGVQKGREAALGEQHRLGEAREIEAGDLGDALQLVVGLRAEDGAVAGREFDFRRLQRAVGLVAGAALAPEGAVDGTLDLEFDLGQAVGGVPRHDVVVGRRDRLQARRLVVEGEADGVEQRRLAGAGRPGDREQRVVGERRPGEVDEPFAFQRIEVLQAQGENFHASSPRRAATMAR